MQKSHPLRLTTFASSPKGTPLRYAENFPATAKSRPLGEGGLTRSGKTEGVSQPFPFTPPSREKVAQKRPQAFLSNKSKILFPLKMPKAKRRAFKIVPRSKKAAAQKVQRLCGVSHHSQRSAMIHHIPGRLIRPSRCSNTISMVFSFQTVRFSRTAPLAKTEAALKSCRRPKG